MSDVNVTVQSYEYPITVQDFPNTVLVNLAGTQGPVGPQGVAGTGGGGTGNIDLTNYVNTQFDQNISGHKKFFNDIYTDRILAEAGDIVIDNTNYRLYDNTPLLSLDWNRKILFGDDNFFAVDWAFRVLSGDWQAESLKIGGNSVTTGGPYYSSLNLSGFINNLSGYITTGNSDARYYSISNPQNYSTSGNLSATGQNLFNYIVNNSATIANLALTGSTLNNKINSVSGYINNITRNNLTGSGSASYLPKFTIDGSGLINTNIYSNNNFIGINNINPLSYLDISGDLAIRSVLSSGNNINLGNNSFYIHTGYSITDLWRLPSLSNTVGRFYFVKNRGGLLTISGQSNEQLFSTSAVNTLIINSGEGYIISNGGQYWEVM